VGETTRNLVFSYASLRHVVFIPDFSPVADFMMSAEPSSSKSPRQAFFARFSHRALQALETLRHPDSAHSGYLPLILLTGGLRTPGLLRAALASKHADLLGVGRGAVLCPDLPSVLLQSYRNPTWDDIPFHPEPDFGPPRILSYGVFRFIWDLIPKVKLIGAGVGMAWYVVAMRRIANTTVAGRDQRIRPEYGLGGLGSVFWMWFWSPSLGMNGKRQWKNSVPHAFFLLVLLAFATFKLF
jgi:hypothetical protein